MDRQRFETKTYELAEPMSVLMASHVYLNYNGLFVGLFVSKKYPTVMNIIS